MEPSDELSRGSVMPLTSVSRSIAPPFWRRYSGDPNASESASVSPLRSANSTSSAAPACDTNPSPSAVTSTVPSVVVRFTISVSSRVAVKVLSNPDSHGPGGRSRSFRSAPYRRIEASNLAGTVKEEGSEPSTEQLRAVLTMFLSHIQSELHDPSWAPTSDQIQDLHERLAEVYVRWLRNVGRHP